MKTTQNRLFYVAVLTSLFAAWPSYASIVTYAFTGVIDEIHLNSDLYNVEIGQAITGWFRYDDSVPDTLTSGPYHEYFGRYSQDASMHMALGSQSFTCLNGSTYIAVHNATMPSGSDDSFWFQTDRLPFEEGIDFADLSVELYDSTNTVFSSDALPAVLSLPDFTTARFGCGIAPGPMMNYYFLADGYLTSLTRVPEPMTLTWMTLGSTVLFRRRKKSL